MRKPYLDCEKIMDILAQVTLKHLQCFVEVYHSQSVAEAAHALSITQSAASRRISDLEGALGRKLFDRRGRRLIPNAAAQLLLRHAEATLAKLGAGLELVSAQTSQTRPEIAIGALPTVAATLVPTAILAMRQALPDLLIRVETGAGDQLLPRLKAGQLDCVVGRMAPVDQMAGLMFEPLFQDRLALVTRVGHPLAGRIPVLGALTEYPFILPPSNAVVRPVVDSFLAARGIGLPGDRVETAAASVAMALLKQTDAIWLISRGVAEADVAEGRLAFLQIETRDTIGAIGLTHRGDEDGPPEIALFLDILRRETAAL